jgi:hypothetical protein
MNEKDKATIRNYRLCFGSPAGREVLTDLMQFCRFRVPLAEPGEPMDIHAVMLREGARMVFLRIITMMTLNTDELTRLFGGERLDVEEEDAA